MVCRVKLHVLCQSADPDHSRRKRWQIGTTREGWDGAKAGWRLFMYCPGYGVVEATVDSVERKASVTTAVQQLVAKLGGHTSSGQSRAAKQACCAAPPQPLPRPPARSGSLR